MLFLEYLRGAKTAQKKLVDEDVLQANKTAIEKVTQKLADYQI